MTDRLLIKGGIVLTQDPALGEHGRRRRPRRGRQDRGRRPEPVRRRRANDRREPATSSSRASSTPTGTRGRRRSGPARPDFALITYFGSILDKFAPHYRPDDVYAGNLWGSLECINAGITTLVDWSHIINTPEHADAGIRGLQDSKIRSVYAYGFGNTSLVDWWFGPDYHGQRPDLGRTGRAPDPEAVLQLRRRADHDGARDPRARTSASPTSSATTGSSPRSSGSTSPSTSRWTGSATPRCRSRACATWTCSTRTRPTSTPRTSPTRSGRSPATRAGTSRSRRRSRSRWATAGRPR